MNSSVHFSSKSNEWETPRYVFDFLNKQFNFELDAAATESNKLCDNFYTQKDNSLLQNWSKHKSIYCNPPYGRLISKFIKKGYEANQLGSLVVFLIPARVDTKWWHDYCSKGEVWFIKGRLKFINKAFPSYREDGNYKISSAPFPSAIVIFRAGNIPATKYIELKKAKP